MLRYIQSKISDEREQKCRYKHDIVLKVHCSVCVGRGYLKGNVFFKENYLRNRAPRTPQAPVGSKYILCISITQFKGLRVFNLVLGSLKMGRIIMQLHLIAAKFILQVAFTEGHHFHRSQAVQEFALKLYLRLESGINRVISVVIPDTKWIINSLESSTTG